MSDASSGDQYTAAWGTPGPSPAPEPPAERVLEAEPVVDATPWWESVCTELAAGLLFNGYVGREGDATDKHGVDPPGEKLTRSGETTTGCHVCTREGSLR
eukprot:SAG31_NODE_3104_length_4669_cov_3.047702_1_plen_100_part_00